MKSALGWAILIGAAALVFLVVARRADLRLWLQPSFRVTALDLARKQVTLQREHHRYVVDCASVCTSFTVGRSYRLRTRGGVIQYRGIELRIVEEQVFFPNGPGGLG